MKDLFGYEKAKEERDTAMDSVDGHASPEWKSAFYRIIVDIAKRHPDFTTDDVWIRADEIGGMPEVHDRRALGPLMIEACKSGICCKSGSYRPSVRRHLTPLIVWASLIYGK